jgi:hypothetical protein
MLEHKSLHQIPLFWAALIIPIFLGCLLMVVACQECTNIGAIWDRLLFWIESGARLSELADLIRLPVGVSMLSIPLAALVASIHRSSQMNIQLLETQKRNVFSSYFDHKSEFVKLLVEHEESGYNIEGKSLLYMKIFNNSPVHFSPDPMRRSQDRHDLFEIIGYYNLICDSINKCEMTSDDLKRYIGILWSVFNLGKKLQVHTSDVVFIEGEHSLKTKGVISGGKDIEVPEFPQTYLDYIETMIVAITEFSLHKHIDLSRAELTTRNKKIPTPDDVGLPIYTKP